MPFDPPRLEHSSWNTGGDGKGAAEAAGQVRKDREQVDLLLRGRVSRWPRIRGFGRPPLNRRHGRMLCRNAARGHRAAVLPVAAWRHCPELVEPAFASSAGE